MRIFILLLFLFLGGAKSELHAQRLSRLAPPPDWSKLQAFQQSITHDDFLHYLTQVYSPSGAWQKWIQVTPERAVITTREGKAPFILRFAPSRSQASAPSHFWRTRENLPSPTAGKPLNGLRIAIDPGHIGGDWAKVEERWFKTAGSRPVIEGDMTLYVARLLKPLLEQRGATVYLTRSKSAPVTSDRPNKLLAAARASLRDSNTAPTETNLRKESEILFYRFSEIRMRGRLVNERIRPDLVLCLHFNAEAWGNEARPSFVKDNHLHFLVSGAFSGEELAYEDQRFGMLFKLLSRSFEEELAVTKEVARSMAEATGLPPFEYKSSKAINIGGGPYIWARNLLANRIMECPVIFAEPYVMNNATVFARIQAGDYSGLKMVAGKERPSIYREYAQSIANGLVAYYSKR